MFWLGIVAGAIVTVIMLMLYSIASCAGEAERLAQQQEKKMIYVCSQLRGDIEGNKRRAAAYCKHVAETGAIPIAPHLYFTQFLSDTIASEREMGMKLGLDIINRMRPGYDELWIFGDRISAGMMKEVEEALKRGITVKNVFNGGENVTKKKAAVVELRQGDH